METVNMIFVMEIIGTVAFAISGAMVGISKKMDLFGVCMLGMTTAVGGGIVRDLLIGVTPPNAFTHPVYALLSLVVSAIVFLPGIRERIDPDSKAVIVIDSIGLGIFTVIGVQSGAEYGNVFLEVFLGTVTGIGGGIMRDLFAAEKPSVFVRHFYATASMIGALLCAILLPYSEPAAVYAGAALIIVLRLCAARFKWHLPKA